MATALLIKAAKSRQKLIESFGINLPRHTPPPPDKWKHKMDSINLTNKEIGL